MITYLIQEMVTFDAYVYQNFDPIGFPKVKRAANNRREKFVHEEGFMISMISTDINPSELKSFAVKHFNQGVYNIFTHHLRRREL